jgi:hypothetical protein
MRYPDLFFCPCCDGEAQLSIDTRTDEVTLDTRDCDESCDLTDEQLKAAYDASRVVAAERAAEASLNGDNGPLPIQVRQEQARRLKR